MQTSKIPPKPLPTRCIFYARVSSDSQVKDGTSLETQLDRGKAFCSSQGWSLAAIFKEEGESGKSTDRTAFQDMLTYLQTNCVNTLLVFKLDRLFRNAKDMLIFIDDELEPRDISLVSISEAFDTGSPQGRLFLSMLGSFSEFERSQIVQRCMSGKIARARQGAWLGGRVPFGYRRIEGSEYDFDIHLEEAKTVKKIFRLYSHGKGYLKISKAIDGAITAPGIGKILNNPFYIGQVRFNSIVRPNNHPSIVSERLFKKCAKIRHSKQLAICAV